MQRVSWQILKNSNFENVIYHYHENVDINPLVFVCAINLSNHIINCESAYER